MTKADLIEEVSRVVEMTRKESEVIVEAIFDSIVRSLRNGDKIEIRGFGSFRTRRRRARAGPLLAGFRPQRSRLTESGVRGFARCHQLGVDPWQRFARPARLRRALHDGLDAVHQESAPIRRTPLHKTCVAASCRNLLARTSVDRCLRDESYPQQKDDRPTDNYPPLLPNAMPRVHHGERVQCPSTRAPFAQRPSTSM